VGVNSQFILPVGMSGSKENQIMIVPFVARIVCFVLKFLRILFYPFLMKNLSKEDVGNPFKY
jgi:hypothetical protein